MVPEEQQKSSVEETFGPVIYSYSRAQAIEDGVLVDLTANFPNDTRLYRWPVACTSTVWNLIEKASQKIPGGPDPWVWDLCWMSIKAKTKVFSDREHLFVCTIGRKAHTFKVNCGPGDQGEPVITIMMSDED